MTLSYTFRPEDEQRLVRIFGRVTMRMSFLIVLIVVAPLFIFIGVALATEELLPGILLILVGIGTVFRGVSHLRYRAVIRRRFRESVGSSFTCSWVLDETGITSTDQKEKMPWPSFSQALMCPEGLVLTGNAFAWIPKEALAESVDLPSIRQLILKHRIRYEEKGLIG